MPVIVVVAAGRGRQYQGVQHKLLEPLGGSTVLGATLQQALASGLPLVVVTTGRLMGAATRVVAQRDVVEVPDAGGNGHGESALNIGRLVALGVSARPQASGWLVLPADLALVRPSTLLAVAQALRDHPVTYAQHRGRRGHPVGFSAELYSELIGLSGDEGARRIVARYPAQAVAVDDPGALLGVDTEADLDALRLAFERGAATDPELR